MRRRSFAGLTAALLIAAPSLAQACAACGVGNGRNKMAFLITTVVLSLLPLGFLAGLIFWITRNAKGWLASEFRESDEEPAATPDAGPGPS